MKKDPFMIWNVPPSLKKRFKAKCASQKVTMRHVILRFMEEYSKSRSQCSTFTGSQPNKPSQS